MKKGIKIIINDAMYKSYIEDGYVDKHVEYFSDKVLDLINQRAEPQWISLKEFQKEANEGLCWIDYKGRVVQAYHDHNGMFRLHSGSLNCYMRECIKAVMIIYPPESPKE